MSLKRFEATKFARIHCLRIHEARTRETKARLVLALSAAELNSERFELRFYELGSILAKQFRELNRLEFVNMFVGM